MTRRLSSNKSVSSKSTISTAVTTTSYSTTGSSSTSGAGYSSPSHKRGSVFGGLPSPKTTTAKTIEHRSPTNTTSSNNNNDIMARVVDRSGAFPQMPTMANNNNAHHNNSAHHHHGYHHAKGSGGDAGSISSGSATSGAIPISPRRAGHNHPQIPPSPSHHKQQLRGVPSSGASVGSSTGNNGMQRTSSPLAGMVSASGRSTPTRQHNNGVRRPFPVEEDRSDDNATYMSHHSYNSQGGGGGRYAHSPSNRGGGAGGDASVASNSSGPRFAASVAGSTASKHHPMGDNNMMSLPHDSVKQKGIAKRKRKEYAKDPRYTPVRRVVDELNKAIGPDKRRTAIERACIEFDHGNDLQHNAELYLGAANVLCLVLSMSDQEDEIRTICSALEMVYRAEREAVVISYQDVGAALVPLLLRLLERCEKGRKVISAEATIGHISRILLHMTRISELRVPLAGHPGMLAALERVATLPLSMENRVLRMRLLANLANSEGNKATIFQQASLMEATMKVATLDKVESAREYASAVLMDLSSCSANQVAMARMDKMLATLVKLAVVEDKTETREYSVSGLQNLAYQKQNRMQLVSYGSGVVVEALKKCTSSDTNDKTRRRSAGALTNLACDETAETMANHAGLFETLARASVSDKNRDVQQRATLALTKLANSITVKMSCWSVLLDALITASGCTVADGIVSAMFRVKTRAEENRTSMANHPRLLETLAQLCLRTKDADDKKSAYKDCENAIKAIAHLANDPHNHKLICNKQILAALVHGASLDGHSGMVTRDAAILAMERMAMDHSNRPMMAHYPGMLVSIAQATEREMNEELNGIPASSITGQPRLAKPLLMSLLVAM